MEGEDARRHPVGCQAGKDVIITVYEEPVLRPNDRPSTENSRPRPPSLGYDRRGLLLAYSQELRQLHAQQSQTGKKIPRPDWKEWKAAFAFTDLSKRRNGLRWKFGLWIRRVLGSVRRRQCDYEPFIPEDENSRSCCDHVEAVEACAEPDFMGLPVRSRGLKLKGLFKQPNSQVEQFILFDLLKFY